MILFIFLQISSHFPVNNKQLHSTFCVCQSSYIVNCSKICGQYKIIDFKSSSISNCLKDYDQELINFMIAGTASDSSEMMPKFYLNDFQNISVIFFSLNSHDYSLNNGTINSKNSREHIILYNGTTGKSTNTLFTNINIHFLQGKYEFNNLHLFNTDFTSYQTDEVATSLHQRFLSSDYDSISRIPITISHYGPTKGAEIECDKNVNNVLFMKNEKILFSGKNNFTKQCLLDLSQVSQKYNTTITLNSRELNISFDPIPTNKFEIPKIIFKMQSNSKIFINSDQFENDKMLIDRITFSHKSKTLYLYSKNGTIPPTFTYIGSGYRYLNNKKRVFFNKYCICQQFNCEEKCGKNIQIINGFDSVLLDETVVGNPYESLTYFIANSKETEGNYPVFDLEHFGDRKLTIIGATQNEHIGFIGDATDDIGEFSFSKLTMHTKNGQNLLLFPNVSFHNVKIYQLQISQNSIENGKTESDKEINQADEKNKNGKKSEFELNNILFKKHYILRCTYLIIDYPTLKNFVTNEVSIPAPQNGVDIHTSSIDEDSLSLCFLTSNQVEVNKLVNISLMPHTTLTIYSNKNINFFISPHFPHVVASFPKLQIVLEGDESNVTFPSEKPWPTELSDISAKVTIIHNDATVYMNGYLDPQKNEYQTKPPIVNQKGTGSFFLNGHLSNFKDAYCVCEGNFCTEICKTNENRIDVLLPPIKFSEKDIEKTVIGNPTSQIEYFIHGSSPENRPLFGLHTFKSKSFSIVGCFDEKSIFDNETKSKTSEKVNDDDEEEEEFKITNLNKTNENIYNNNNENANQVFQYISLEGTDQPSNIVSSSVSHIFTNVDILLTNAGIYFFNNVVFNNCRVNLNKSISLKPRDGMTRFFKIIQSGMTIDMPTLHSFNSYGGYDYITVPSPTYLTVNGGANLYKIIIDDMYHLALLDKENKLDSRVDVSLLKRNPPNLRTMNGKSENEPFVIEMKKNNDVRELNDVPHFIVDVSDLDSDDAYISFVGNKWNREFHNLSSKITIKHKKINVHLISEKVVSKKAKKSLKIKPPIINFDGDGDIYIDDKKQISRSAFINDNIILTNYDDYFDDESLDYREKIHYIIIIAVSIFIGFVFCFALYSVMKHKQLNSYGKMGNINFLMNRENDNQINEFQIEPFKNVEEQSD